MNQGRLRAFARKWLGPALAGLSVAAVAIAGAEIGGAIGWVLIAVAAAAILGIVVWTVRTLYADDDTDWPNDEI